MSNFVHLHNHSEYSLLDGAQTTKEMAARAAELGMPAMSITDHGRMGGVLSFYNECNKVGVKPILGMEAYITSFGRSMTERVDYLTKTKQFEGTPMFERSNYHLILLCKNYTGYKNLCALSRESFSNGFYRKPRIDYATLEKYHEGLIASSACIIGAVSNKLLNNDYDGAREIAVWMRRVFGDDYYLEIMNHGLDMELAVMQGIRDLGKELDIPVIATNDDHYTRKEDHNLQKTLMLMSMHKSWSDSNVSGSFFIPNTDTLNIDDMQSQAEVDDKDAGESDPIFETPAELYMKNYDEMLAALRVNGGENGVAERELANTLDVAAKCNCELPIIDSSDTSQYHTPVYNIPMDIQYKDYMADGSHEIPAHTAEAIVKGMNDDGIEGDTLEKVLTQHELDSLKFILWICTKNMNKLVVKKIQAKGEPLPDEFWIKNKPSEFQIVHAHNSPDEQWIKKNIESGKTVDDIINLYWERLDYELSIVCRKHFLDYFEIVQQYANYTRLNGGLIGPARGSGAGSLLNYLIGITSIDPLPNGLLFERFLNPDRLGYPDIDLDFTKDWRDNKLWPYLRDFYGKNNTSQIATYQFFWGKAAIRAAARTLFNPPLSLNIADSLVDLVDDKPKLDLNNELDPDNGNEAFIEMAHSSMEHRQVIKLALMLQGRISGESQHASAYIVSPDKLIDKMPLMVSKDERELSQKSGIPVDNYLIQLDGRETQDYMGYVKLDLLCIADLNVMDMTLKSIKDIYGCDIDIENIPLDDKGVFSMLIEGYNAGIFQFDGSPVAIRILQDSGANCIADWSAISALNRPGPLGMHYDKQFVEGKKNAANIHYFTPAAESYLKNTYGTTVFQEQLMQLSQDNRIVGFTRGEADTMRKILAHKDKAKIKGIVDLAHERAEKNHVPKAVVDEFCDMAVAAGSYSFNACLTGDTTVYRANTPSNDKKFPTPELPLSEVYRRFNASGARNSPDAPIRSKYRASNPARGLFILCRDNDGRARKHKVKNIFNQGEREVFLITLENGKSVKATANHRFQTVDGYKRVDELIIGSDELWCCDFIYKKESFRKYTFSDESFEHGAYAKGKTYGHHRGFKNGADNPAYTNGGYSRFMEYSRTHSHCEVDGCDKCRENGDRIEIPHINGDRSDNSDDNLMAMCVSHHKKADYARGRRKHGEKGYDTYLSKIISIEPVGVEQVFDVEIESDEHNFFANGISSHNSHSLAYAVIGYRGAFLKYHFPECFLASMCAIKSNQKGKDKIPDYLTEARQLGVTVKPPHVNLSRDTFSVPERGTIVFGLDKIKGVGAAAKVIIDERDANGKYRDFTDFCTRVPRSVTKAALGPLIDAGALDGLGWTRKAMHESLDQIAEFRKNWFAEKARQDVVGGSLFGGFDMGGGEPSSAMPPIDLVPPFDTEYTRGQIMRQEKSVFGMYFSGDPEDEYRMSKFLADRRMEEDYAAEVKLGHSQMARPIRVKDIASLPDRTPVELTCKVVSTRIFKSGKGASVSVSDWGVDEESRFGFSPMSYSSRLTVFDRVWSTIPTPQPDTFVHVVGKVNVDKKGDFPPSVIVDSIEQLPRDSEIYLKQDVKKLLPLQNQMVEEAVQVADPMSDRYLVPVVTFPDRESLDAFLLDENTIRIQDRRGRVIVRTESESDGGKIENLKQTMGMVHQAARFGGKAAKVRLPKAESAAARLRMMHGDNFREVIAEQVRSGGGALR